LLQGGFALASGRVDLNADQGKKENREEPAPESRTTPSQPQVSLSRLPLTRLITPARHAPKSSVRMRDRQRPARSRAGSIPGWLDPRLGRTRAGSNPRWPGQ